MTRKWILIMLVVTFILGGATAHLKLFPDPYHEGDNVDLWTWIYRELDELVHGEH